VDLWHVNEDTLPSNLKQLHSQETVYTIGNGYFCTRGTFEEGYSRANPATLLYGVFDEIPLAKEELANAPDWIPIRLFVNGERFRLDQGKILDYNRSLDLRTGVLRRSVRWESPKGIRIQVVSERFASLADEHVGAIRYSVTFEEGAGTNTVAIALLASFNTAVGNYDVMHWETVDQGNKDDLLWFHAETKRTYVQLAQTMSFTADCQSIRKEFIDSFVAPSIRLYGTIASGETVTAEKTVVMYTSRDCNDPVQAALNHHNAIKQKTYEQLRAKNEDVWQQFWQRADVIIEGDTKAQLGMRYNIYQLRINVSAHDSRYSIAAKGLTGFGYRGHVFHDTEIFMLPFFTYVMPEIARNLLLYRYHTLPAARQKAANNGYKGAQYAWESTLSGEEVTPPSIIHPETGEVIPVLNGSLELHITASIAHAVWQYWCVAGDDDFMREYGAEILLNTAMFWASRAQKNTTHNDYEITNVVGPDEWHEHVNNNAYTNYMARWNIQMGLETLDWLQTTAPAKAKELSQEIGLTKQELDHWRDVERHLCIPQDQQTGLFEQFDGFFKLQHLDQSKYKGRRDSYQAILGMKGVQEYQIVKQADVLMLLTVLDDQFDLKTKRVNWDYYYPITDHDYGSSLTPALHVILACELGQTEAAYDLFTKGNLVDLENLRGNTPEGIHAACAGAVWQAAIFGFAGLRVTDDDYFTNAHWPDGWTRLAFNFMHCGQLIHVDLHR